MYKFEIKELGRKHTVSYPKKQTLYLCDQVGIDFDADREYRWFLHQVLQSILPLGWNKEYDPYGYIQYHHSRIHFTTQKHPLIFKFRKAFLLLAKNDANNPTFIMNSKAIEHSSFENQKVTFKKLLNMVEKDQESGRDADGFYAMLLNNCQTAPPTHIEETGAYQLIHPQEMMAKAKELGIDKDYRFLWLARTFMVLQLPPLWRSESGPDGVLYFAPNSSVPQLQHPAVPYIKTLVSTVKSQSGLKMSFLMEFHDKEFHKYQVDLRKLVNNFDYVVYNENTPNTELKRRVFQATGNCTMDDALEHLMVFELAESLGIELEKEIHMIGGIFQFVDSIKSVQQFKDWEFRFTAEGKKYWYNRKNNTAKAQLPFRQPAIEFLKKYRQETLARAQECIRPYTERHVLFESNDREFFENTRAEALQVTTLLIKKYSDTEDAPESHEVSENVKKQFFTVNRHKLLNLLFASPFVTESSLDYFQSIKSFIAEDVFPESDVVPGCTLSNNETIQNRSSLKNNENGSYFRNKTAVEAQLGAEDTQNGHLVRSQSIYYRPHDEEPDIESLSSESESAEMDKLVLGESPLSKYTALKEKIEPKHQAPYRKLYSEQDEEERMIPLKLIRNKTGISLGKRAGRTTQPDNTVREDISNELTNKEQSFSSSEESEGSEGIRRVFPNEPIHYKTNVSQNHLELPENNYIDSNHLEEIHSPNTENTMKKEKKEKKPVVKFALQTVVHDIEHPDSFIEDIQEESADVFNESIEERHVEVQRINNTKEITEKSPSKVSRIFEEMIKERTKMPGKPRKTEETNSGARHNPQSFMRIQGKKFETLLPESQPKLRSTQKLSTLTSPNHRRESSQVKQKVVELTDKEFIHISGTPTLPSAFESGPTTVLSLQSRTEPNPVKFSDLSPILRNSAMEFSFKQETVTTAFHLDYENQPQEKPTTVQQAKNNSLAPLSTEQMKNPIECRRIQFTAETTKPQNNNETPQLKSHLVHPEAQTDFPQSKRYPEHRKLNNNSKPPINNQLSNLKHPHNEPSGRRRQLLPPNEPTDGETVVKLKYSAAPQTDRISSTHFDPGPMVKPHSTSKGIVPKTESPVSPVQPITKIPPLALSSCVPVPNPVLSVENSNHLFSSRSNTNSLLSNQSVLNLTSKFFEETSQFSIKSAFKLEDLSKQNSNRKHTSPRKQRNSKGIAHFQHYFEVLGHPYKPAKLFSMKPKSYIDPNVLILMGLRLGLNVSFEPLKSTESDLLWIPFLQLTAPPPAHTKTNPIVLANSPIGSHPGDYYFIILLEYHRKLKQTRLKHLQNQKLLIENSWVLLKTKANKDYYHNFMTGEAIHSVQKTINKQNLVAPLRKHISIPTLP